MKRLAAQNFWCSALKLSLCATVVTISLSCAVLPMCADEPPKPSSLSIEGGVKGTAVNFDQGISFINSASMPIEQASELIIRDATRKDTVVMRGPNVLPNGTVIPPLGGVGGVMQMGSMPMHLDKLQRWVSVTEHNMQMLQSYVDGLIIPAEKIPLVEQQYTDLRKVVDFANLHLQRLKDLSGAKKLSNNSIAREAFFIHDAMEDVRRRCATLSAAVNGKAISPGGSGTTTGGPQVKTHRHTVTTTTDSSTWSGIQSTSKSSTTNSVETTTDGSGDSDASSDYRNAR